MHSTLLSLAVVALLALASRAAPASSAVTTRSDMSAIDNSQYGLLWLAVILK